MVGLDIPVKPQRGQVLVTEPTRFYPCRYLMDIDYLIVEHSQTEKLDVTINLVQHKHGNWTIGSSREFAGFVNKTTHEGIAVLARKATKFLLDLGLEHCIRSYSGLRPFCHFDGNPILGQVDKIRGFVIATGHGGSGIKFAPVTGKLIAEEIIQGELTALLAPYRYSRFV
ncbi:MAG: FAD-dependent oxidoreductase [Candidatus Aenigmarchaeota archaeon]|nr:FAD-dependent oxidoreductase [Candidatus Aenigmarchaeota archaeon]